MPDSDGPRQFNEDGCIYQEPILGKRPRFPHDRAPFTWGLFLNIRAFARWLAVQEQASVYLVGSALYKRRPHDIDVAVCFPMDAFQARWGQYPKEMPGHRERLPAYLNQVFADRLPAYLAAQIAVGHRKRIDLRYCPDWWWPQHPRLLLADHRQIGGEPVADRWGGYEFYFPTLIHSGRVSNSEPEPRANLI